MTGYGEAEKACFLMDFRHLISSTGVVRVLHSQRNTQRVKYLAEKLISYKPFIEYHRQ